MSDRAAIEIRVLSTTAEFEQAVELQREIWGFDELELLPVRFFVVAASVGGQTFGAYDGERMVGFLLAIPGIKPTGKLYLHSHMTGVLEAYRNRGVGRMLKLRQREDALARGFDLVEWTFDPLELKNAYFNIERLGVVVRRYVLNQYGVTSSHLHGGLPTDRCVAEWWIRSPRVESVVHGEAAPRPPVEARIEVPVAIGRWRGEDPREARRVQEQVSARFLELLDRGLAVIGFERTPSAGVYLLGRWSPE
ncbi:MAG: GNAT family N-acetyltransferase [Bryobacterales bacterium]|nr:GNAT family N-acetyltransferase [Bryobacterales bacterium]